MYASAFAIFNYSVCMQVCDSTLFDINERVNAPLNLLTLSVFVCMCPGVTLSKGVRTLISASVRVLGCSISLIACVLEGELFDLGALPGLSTHCAGWSPIMLG